MKNSEFLRLIEEIGVFLELRMTTIVQAIEFYKLFTQSETHSYKQEVEKFIVRNIIYRKL